MPVTADSAPASPPPCRSSIQRSGQRRIRSTSDGDTGTTSPGARSGASVETGRGRTSRRRGARYTGLGEAGQLDGRAAAALLPCGALPRLRRTALGPTQLPDQLGEHERPARPMQGALRAVALVVGHGIQLVEEPRRLLVAAPDPAALHGADQERLPRAGARDVEQPPLLGQQRCNARHGRRGLGDARDDVDQPLVAEQAAPQSQVRPGALLHARHGHDAPLTAASGVGRQQRDRVGLGSPGGQGVSG